jgi:hypothetical protein
MGHPSLKVSAPLPRENEIPVPSLRRTQRQDGSQQMSHVRIRNRFCPRMLGNSFCRDPDSPDWSDNGYFRSLRSMHPSHMLREGAWPNLTPLPVLRGRQLPS